MAPPSATSSSGLQPVAFKKLYTYATSGDIIFNILACICATASGCILPLFSLVFGSALNILNDPLSDIVSAVSRLSLYFLLIALGAGLLSFLEVALVATATEKQLQRLRTSYVDRLLTLDFAWYDTHRAGESVSRLAEATISVGTGMEKVPTVLRYTATLLAGLAIGFSTSWKLTLVIMGCAPMFAIALSILILTVIRSEKAERTAYARAGDAASEVFSLIRAVSAYGGEQHENMRYGVFLAAAEAAGIRKGVGIGVAVGLMLFSFYAMYGVSTWAGAQFVIESRAQDVTCRFFPNADGCFSGGDIITTFVSVLLGALSFGQIGPLMGQISAARAAAADLYGVIDAAPGVDVRKEGGYTGSAAGGSTPEHSGQRASSTGVRIEFKNVTFAYPSRPDVPVLKDFNLLIQPGQCVGVVGASGSGKSTLGLLILRAYDPEQGQVLIDGVDVKEWHLPSLRNAIGLVSQDPVLFGVSVAENIALGKPATGAALPSAKIADSDSNSSGLLSTVVSQEEIVAAAKAANAHGFISSLPQAYDTPAGTGVSASQLSGGQKQRICIARAIIRNPRLLLLDEATSALDTASERVVQAALDGIAQGGKQTTLAVAHRLSTLLNSDRIIVMQGGQIVEEGSPAELLAKPVGQGIFRSMKAAQDIADPHAAGGTASTPTSASAADAAGSTEQQLPAGAAPVETTAAQPAELVLRTVETEGKEGKEGGHKVATLSPSPSPSAAEDSEPSYSTGRLWARMWYLQREDWPVMMLGAIGAAGSGCIQPIVSIVYGDIIAIFFIPSDETMKKKSLEYLGWFFLLGAASLVGVFCRVSVFTYLGERLTRKLRAMCYNSILRQPASFFDNSENSVGRLATRLATDAALVKGSVNDSIGTLLEGFGAIACAIVIAFIASWRLALVLMAVFPFLIIGSIFEFKSVSQSSKGSNKKLEDAGNSVSEAITAIRTVTAYNLQAPTLALYRSALVLPMRAGIARGVTQGAGQGFQRFMLMCAYSLAFYAGAQFINDRLLVFSDLIRTFLAITLAAEAVGRIASQAPDSAKADAAARAIFKLIDVGNASPIDPLSASGVTSGVTGNKAAGSHEAGGLRIEFKNVTFAYPSRPDVPVLKDFNLLIQPGQCVGVVGASGSGKSTLSLLILRAYDPQHGSILVDGVDIRDWNVSALRAACGLVQQEPALFADSIGYNIAYGVPGPAKMKPGQGVQPKETGDDAQTASKGGRGVSSGSETAVKTAAGEEEGSGMAKTSSIAVAVSPTGTTTVTGNHVVYPPPPADVVLAAEAANAAGFISSLPDTYASYCGSRGSQLSGGQKQRVAIARALLRAPRLLLLDEATSALDSASEKIVQEALDRILAEGRAAAAGPGEGEGTAPRTALVIAHRLSTLSNADRIVVLEKGRIVEDGTHSALMSVSGGKYRALALAQQGGGHT